MSSHEHKTALLTGPTNIPKASPYSDLSRSNPSVLLEPTSRALPRKGSGRRGPGGKSVGGEVERYLIVFGRKNIYLIIGISVLYQ